MIYIFSITQHHIYMTMMEYVVYTHIAPMIHEGAKPGTEPQCCTGPRPTTDITDPVKTRPAGDCWCVFQGKIPGL